MTMMKPKIAVITLCLAALLSHGGVAAAQSCPEELPGQVQLTGSDLIFHYGILSDEGVLCGKLESKSNKAWVAFGAQPEGKKQMIGARAIIALPSDNTVQQYMLNTKSDSGINLLSEGDQTLTETSVTQEGGGTVARFKLPLDFNGLKLTSKNVYMLALGNSNDLGYHKNRGFVTLDFEKNISIASTSDESEQDQNLRGQAIYSTLE